MKLFFATLLFLNSFLTVSAQEAIRFLCGPWLQQVSETEATVMWITNNRSTAWVELAPDDETHFYNCERPRYYESLFGRIRIGTLHSVKITGLEPGKSYRYRIFSQEILTEEDYYVQAGQIIASNVYSAKPLLLKTPSNQNKSLTFSVVNDIHADTALLRALLKDVNTRKPEFVLFNGDMLSDMRSEKQLIDGFMGLSANLFAKETPIVFARGNHEARGTFSEAFIRYFPTPTGTPYYTFRQGPVFFIVLDPGEDKPDNDIEYHGLGDFDNYRAQEAKWLKEVIESQACKEAPYRVVITHVPPTASTWHGNVQVKEKMIPLLNKANIQLMLCGHLHAHHYFANGSEGCNFPILINHNKHAYHVKADEKGIAIEIRDNTGELVKNIQIPKP